MDHQITLGTKRIAIRRASGKALLVFAFDKYGLAEHPTVTVRRCPYPAFTSK